jgi:hypothetical protein
MRRIRICYFNQWAGGLETTAGRDGGRGAGSGVAALERSDQPSPSLWLAGNVASLSHAFALGSSAATG